MAAAVQLVVYRFKAHSRRYRVRRPCSMQTARLPRVMIKNSVDEAQIMHLLPLLSLCRYRFLPALLAMRIAYVFLSFLVFHPCRIKSASLDCCRKIERSYADSGPASTGAARGRRSLNTYKPTCSRTPSA